MSKKTTIKFIGLDVHQYSITLAIADFGHDGEVRLYGTIKNTTEALEKIIRKLVSTGAELRFVYEAGPCGFGLYRRLNGNGFNCVVAAPSMIPRKAGVRIKNDNRDAISLARLLRAGELTAIYVPDLEDEAVRDLSRARRRATSDLMVQARSWPQLERLAGPDGKDLTHETQRAPHGSGIGVRTEVPRSVLLDDSGHVGSREFLGESHLDERVALVVLELDVVPGTVFLDQVGFEYEGLRLGSRNDVVKRGETRSQDLYLPVRGLPLARVCSQPAAQIEGLANVDYPPAGALQKIDARTGGDSPR